MFYAKAPSAKNIYMVGKEGPSPYATDGHILLNLKNGHLIPWAWKSFLYKCKPGKGYNLSRTGNTASERPDFPKVKHLFKVKSKSELIPTRIIHQDRYNNHLRLFKNKNNESIFIDNELIENSLFLLFGKSGQRIVYLKFYQDLKNDKSIVIVEKFNRILFGVMPVNLNTDDYHKDTFKGVYNND